MKSIQAVESIVDLPERLSAASALEREARAAQDAARGQRNLAALIAHLDHGVAPVTLYREIMGVSRGAFNKYLRHPTAPSAEVRAQHIADDPEAYGDAEACIATLNEAVRKERQYGARKVNARKVRDDAALLLMGAHPDEAAPVGTPLLSNAEIVHRTGLTSARVAQLRTGSR